MANLKIDDLKNENSNEVSNTTERDNTKSVTFNDSNNIGEKVEVDPSKTIEKKKQPTKNQITDAFDALDRRSEEIKKKAVEAIEKNNERILQEQKEKELENMTNDSKTDNVDTTNITETVDDVVIENDVLSEQPVKEEEVDERINKLKEILKDKLKPVTKKIDISTFTINKNPTKAFKLFDNKFKEKYIADWYLPNSNKMISMSEFTGAEITKLNPNNSSRTQLNTARENLHLIWSHIENTNKPDFENWMKITHISDLEHLYFAIYKASFDGVNTVPYYCTSNDCKGVFVKDVDIMDMVEFENEVDKQAFIKNITNGMDSHYTDEELQLDLAAVQITDDIVVSMKMPSIFSAYLEPMYLSKEFIEKNTGIYELIPYIEDIYIINEKDHTLDPIEYTVYKNSVSKTIASKYDTFIYVLKQLTSDQFYTLNTLLRTMNKDNMNVTYCIPEQICPECGHKIEKDKQSALDILFTRHQLAVIANM